VDILATQTTVPYSHLIAIEAFLFRNHKKKHLIATAAFLIKLVIKNK